MIALPDSNSFPHSGNSLHNLEAPLQRMASVHHVVEHSSCSRCSWWPYLEISINLSSSCGTGAPSSPASSFREQHININQWRKPFSVFGSFAWLRSPRVPGVWLQWYTHTRHLFCFAAARGQKPWALWWHHPPHPNTCSSALPPSAQLSQHFCSADVSQLSATLSSSTLQFHRTPAATCTHARRLNTESYE